MPLPLPAQGAWGLVKAQSRPFHTTGHSNQNQAPAAPLSSMVKTSANTRQQSASLCFIDARCSGLDRVLPQGVQPLLPLLLLGLQVLFVLVEPAAHGTRFLGPQVQGLVLLALGDGRAGGSEGQGLGATAAAKQAPEVGTRC